MRIDVYLVSAGLAETRERAQELISVGLVTVNGKLVQKNSSSVQLTDEVLVCGTLRFVSRGGNKLQAAIDAFHLNFNGKRVLDIGASTGGFTDCALQNGAISSVCVDVGHGQLAKKLIDDERVSNLEGVHVKNLREYYFAQPDYILVDVSFISLKQVIPFLSTYFNDETEGVFLIKPQFEIPHKKAVLSDPSAHRTVLKETVTCFQSFGLTPVELIPSPVVGTEGNHEYLAYVKKNGVCPFYDFRKIADDALNRKR